MRNTSEPHPVCHQLRALRKASGLSLIDLEEKVGMSAIAVGSYERGDRQPPLEKIEKIFNAFGYTVVAVPMNHAAVRLPSDMASELRAIAAQLELSAKGNPPDDVPSVPFASTQLL